MSTQASAQPAARTKPGERPVRAIRRSFSRPIASLFAIATTVLWTLPTFGLLVTSIRPAREVATTGWWSFFADPDVTLSNYETVLFQNTFGSSAGLLPYLINSLAITVPAT